MKCFYHKDAEEWKDISGYKDRYQISSWGNVMSLFFVVPRLLKPAKDKDGYLRVGLVDKFGKRKYYSIHRLVGFAFIPNPLNLPIINHKDVEVSNCDVDNLEWCTIQYNCQYKFTHGYVDTCGDKRSNAKITNKQAIEIYSMTCNTALKDKEIAKIFNTTFGSVNSIRTGRKWSKITNYKKQESVKI